MKITPKIRFVSGSFDTKEVKLVLVPSDNHGLVELCVKEPDSGWNLRIASEESHLRNLSQEIADCDKHFDNVLKDSFLKEQKLNIAAMAMQGMLSNTTRFSSYEISDLVRISLNCADALLSECEKGGEDV